MQPIAPLPLQPSPAPAAPAPARGSVTAPRPGARESDAAQLQEAVAATRAAVRALANNIEFSVDQRTGKTLIRVIDSHTGEVIRQIPGEEMLAIARTLDRLQGLIFHRTA